MNEWIKAFKEVWLDERRKHPYGIWIGLGLGVLWGLGEAANHYLATQNR